MIGDISDVLIISVIRFMTAIRELELTDSMVWLFAIGLLGILTQGFQVYVCARTVRLCIYGTDRGGLSMNQ